MRESATGPIHPGALPSGSGASGTAWELAGVSARQPSWSGFGCFQHPAGSKMCTSHFMEDIWMLVAPQSDWMQVCVLLTFSPNQPLENGIASLLQSLHAALDLYIRVFCFFSVHLVRQGTEGSLTFTHNTVPHTTPNRTPTLSKGRCKVLSTVCWTWNAKLPDEEPPAG